MTSKFTTTGPAALPVVNPPYPGPYETKEINGVEYRQGRYPDGKFGGTLVRSIVAADPKTFNPWTAKDTTSGALSGLMFSGLVAVDPFTGDVIPDMVSKFTV